MKILFVAADKNGSFSPFVVEQRETLVNLGISVFSYAHNAHGIPKYFQEIKHLRKTIMDEQPDVVHAHFGFTGLLATLAVRGLNIPVVVTYHGCDINDTKNRPFSRMAMRLSAWNIFVSYRQMVNAFGSEKNASSNKKWSIIPCGVNVATCDEKYVNDRWFNSKFPSSTYVLFAGSFESTVKNSILAKQTIDIYNQHHPEHPIKMLELRGYSRTEVVTLMHRCSTLLLTSIREGSPQVVKEAMACGCPIVSVDVGDVLERVESVEGCYVASSRDPQELARLLERSIAVDRTKGREKLLEDGLDNTQVAEKLIDIYKKLTKK